MQAVCPQCNTLNSLDNKFCGDCGASLENAEVVKKVSQAETRAESDSQETTYYSSGNVSVTSKRAVFGAKTYSVANITSVEMADTPPDRKWPNLILLAGAALLVLSGITNSATPGIIGLIIVGVGLFLLFRAKRRYVVRLASASGETEALVSDDRDLIEKIVAAIQNAIAERG